MRPWFVLGALLLFSPAWGDVVHLKDGTRVEGTVKRESGGWAVQDAAGQITHVNDDRVASVEKVGTVSTADQATSGLLSLRRSVESLNDIPRIIDRYQRFIEQFKSTPAAQDAAKDLAMWQDRQSRGLVKVGDQWVTAEQRAALRQQIFSLVDQGRQLVKQNRLREADALVAKVLEMESGNVSGLYVRGVIAYQQDQIGVARKAFEQVRQSLPDHGPTLNNLAAIYWRQSQYMNALSLYDRAMIALPRHRQVLDNVADALNTLPASQDHTAQAYKKAQRRYLEQEPLLEQQMAQEQKLYRWGAGWVTSTQLDDVRKAEQDIKNKLDVLAADYKRIQDRITGIDQEVQANERLMATLDNQSLYYDQNGQPMYLPRPAAYYQLEDTNRRLDQERKQLQQSLAAFPAKAQAIRQQLPVPRFTGIHQLIGVEGTPLVLPPSPGVALTPPPAETQPAAEPVVPATLPAAEPATLPTAAPAEPAVPADPPAAVPASQPAGGLFGVGTGSGSR